MSFSPQRCSNCVLSASFPNIQYDENGICNFCRDQLYSATEETTIDRSKAQIEELFHDQCGKYEYDAVMCYSGGKDSTYTLLTAVRKYGLKTLALTLDNGFISPVAFSNIRTVCDALGVDSLIFRPSKQFFRKLIRVSLLEDIYAPRTLVRISAGCSSCISMVNNIALKIALEKNIPFVLAGFTLGQIPSNAILYKNNYTFFKESRKPILEKLRFHLGDEIDNYFCIRDALLQRSGSSPYSINLLCVEDPTESEMVGEIQKLGWKSPKDVDGCSSNCRLNGLNNYIHQKQFNFSPYELELSHLVRKGKITRDEALRKLSTHLSPEAIESLMDELKISLKDIDSNGKQG